MPLPIEDYALIGNCRTAALVGSDGSIDWLCFPRFDSGACFAALLGGPEHGRWLMAPTDAVRKTLRKYRKDTLVLETDFETETGTARVIDFMPLADRHWDLVRVVEGLDGSVAMRMELIIRFDYGSIVPWVHRVGHKLLATAGPDTLELVSSVAVHGENMKTVAEFQLAKGQRVHFTLSYRRSYVRRERALDTEIALQQTDKHWRGWSERCTYRGPWREVVLRSLITLKALTYVPTGGMVAAPTTSLPESRGGTRNWDYRYCWLRDAAFTLNALLATGYHKEALAWREWLLRAAAGSPRDLQILYSLTGKHRIDETVLEWLPGYSGAAPVRLGNAASRQFQLDVYGEVMDTLHLARIAGMETELDTWNIQVKILEFLESRWQQPDEGIWEVRGPRRHFTHSKVMAWVAFDRAIKDMEAFGLEGPIERWKQIRDAIHVQVCSQGFDAKRNTFVQYYGSKQLDASLLLMPLVGFLPPEDPRVRGTVEAIEKNLIVDGLVLRYSTNHDTDGLPPGEGAFLPCSFWLVDCLILCGRRPQGEALFERLVSLCNDLGLFSEEYDTKGHQMLGNFPQALTHMALVNSAILMSMAEHEIAHAAKSGERPATVKSRVS